MKSSMVTNLSCVVDKDGYTDLRVCKSAAGYYIGTMYFDKDLEMLVPGSRDSEYFLTEEGALRYLAMLETVEHPEEYLRSNP